MSLRVRISVRAAADFEHRLRSTSILSPDVAQRLIESFDNALIRLRDFPLACGLAYENPSFSEELRHLLFGISRRASTGLFSSFETKRSSFSQSERPVRDP